MQTNTHFHVQSFGAGPPPYLQLETAESFNLATNNSIGSQRRRQSKHPQEKKHGHSPIKAVQRQLFTEQDENYACDLFPMPLTARYTYQNSGIPTQSTTSPRNNLDGHNIHQDVMLKAKKALEQYKEYKTEYNHII
jgi:hypothetical protein